MRKKWGKICPGEKNERKIRNIVHFRIKNDG